jgi:hypothetical protein
MERSPVAAPPREGLSELALRVAVAGAASEGLAILWVCVRRGYGAPDLLPFALWSLLFGLWMGACARAFRDVIRRPYGLPRTGAVSALGLACALAWTMIVIWVFGPWVTALNLPASWLWACAGIAALLP